MRAIQPDARLLAPTLLSHSPNHQTHFPFGWGKPTGATMRSLRSSRSRSLFTVSSPVILLAMGAMSCSSADDGRAPDDAELQALLHDGKLSAATILEVRHRHPVGRGAAGGPSGGGRRSVGVGGVPASRSRSGGGSWTSRGFGGTGIAGAGGDVGSAGSFGAGGDGPGAGGGFGSGGAFGTGGSMISELVEARPAPGARRRRRSGRLLRKDGAVPYSSFIRKVGGISRAATRHEPTSSTRRPTATPLSGRSRSHAPKASKDRACRSPRSRTSLTFPISPISRSIAESRSQPGSTPIASTTRAPSSESV